MAIADSPAAENAAIKAGVGDSFKVDENLVNHYDFANWIEVNTPSTGYWYSKRQPQMPTYSLGIMGDLQRVTSKSEDPIASLEAAAAKVSNFVAWKDTIKTYEQLHKNTYPELFKWYLFSNNRIERRSNFAESFDSALIYERFYFSIDRFSFN